MDSRNRRDGRELERLGWYDPLNANNGLNIKEERVNYWIDNGAQPSDTVNGLFKKTGMNLKRELLKLGKTETEIENRVAEFLEAQAARELRKAEAKAEKLKKGTEKQTLQAEEVEPEPVEAEKKTESDSSATEETQVKVAADSVDTATEAVEEPVDESKEDKSDDSEPKDEKVEVSAEENVEEAGTEVVATAEDSNDLETVEESVEEPAADKENKTEVSSEEAVEETEPVVDAAVEDTSDTATESEEKTVDKPVQVVAESDDTEDVVLDNSVAEGDGDEEGEELESTDEEIKTEDSDDEPEDKSNEENSENSTETNDKEVSEETK